MICAHQVNVHEHENLGRHGKVGSVGFFKEARRIGCFLCDAGRSSAASAEVRLPAERQRPARKGNAGLGREVFRLADGEIANPKCRPHHCISFVGHQGPQLTDPNISSGPASGKMTVNDGQG